MKTNLIKISLIIIIIIAIAILIGTTYSIYEKSTLTTANWKTYTRNVPADKTPYYNNSKFTITIQYPPNWTIKELHATSNRVVDDPKEINTAILSGKEGAIRLAWGPMGFGGVCSTNMIKTIQLKNKQVSSCQYADNQGNQIIGGVSSETDNQPFEANATASSSDPRGNLVKKILSTLQVTN